MKTTAPLPCAALSAMSLGCNRICGSARQLACLLQCGAICWQRGLVCAPMLQQRDDCCQAMCRARLQPGACPLLLLLLQWVVQMVRPACADTGVAGSEARAGQPSSCSSTRRRGLCGMRPTTAPRRSSSACRKVRPLQRAPTVPCQSDWGGRHPLGSAASSNNPRCSAPDLWSHGSTSAKDEGPGAAKTAADAPAGLCQMAAWKGDGVAETQTSARAVRLWGHNLRATS